jgi:hypothetical protein
MADLFNQQISATYSGLLKTTSSGVLTSSLTQITDGRGNGSPLYISTVAINFYNAYSFPSTDGTADQILSTDGAGAITWVDVSGGDVLKTGTIVANEIAIWNDNDSTLRSDPTLTIDTNGEIILVQDGQSGTPSRGMYNIGGGNMSVATGEENTGFGKQNLNNTEGGYHNTAVGAYSLFSLTGGVYNVAIGRNSLYSLIDQSSNTAVGNSSALNFIGSSGTFIGALSGGKRLSGSSNTAIGVNSLVGNSTVSLNTGNSNTAIGDASLNVVSSGSKNVALGKSSGSLITTGSSNVIIGSFTGTTGESPTPVYDIRTSSNNIVISDGDGNIRQTFDNSGDATFLSSVTAEDGYYLKHSNTNTIAALEEFSGTQGAGFSLFNASGTQNVLFNAGGDSFINGGNVGIGTDSPSYKLHVSNNTNGFISRFTGGTSSDVNIGIFGSTAGAFGSIGTESNHPFNIFTNGTDRLTIASTGAATFSSSVTSLAVSGAAVIVAEGSATNGEGVFQVKGKNAGGTIRTASFKYDNSDVIRIGTSSNIGMQFETNDVARLTISSGGNVLIGTTTNEGYKLDVNGTGRFSGTSGAFIGVTIDNTDSTGSSRLRVTSTGSNVTDIISYSDEHASRANQAWLGGDSSSTITVLQAGGVEFLRGASTGNVIIQNNKIYGTGEYLGAIWDSNGGNTTWTIGDNPVSQTSWNLRVNTSAAKDGGGSWGDYSDGRLKKDIKTIQNALDKINKINPVTFEWINPEEHNNQHNIGGFIAQEIKEIFPQFINEIKAEGKDKDIVGENEIVYGLTLPFKFDAYIVKSIQELHQQIQEQQTIIEDLKARIEKLEV